MPFLSKLVTNSQENNINVGNPKYEMSSPYVTQPMVYGYANLSHKHLDQMQKGLHLTDDAKIHVLEPFIRGIPSEHKRFIESFEEGVEQEFDSKEHRKTRQRLLQQFLTDEIDLPACLHETTKLLKNYTKCTGVVLYLVDKKTNEIYISPRYAVAPKCMANYTRRWKIKSGHTVAASVAHHKQYVMLPDITTDDRFPDGTGWRGPTVKAVLCVPVVSPDEECLAVVELYRDTQDLFIQTHLQLVIALTGWIGAAINQHQLRVVMKKKQRMNQYLLERTQMYFADSIDLRTVISQIVFYAKEYLKAERGSFIIVRKKSEELMAEIYEEGISPVSSEELLFKRKRIKTFDKGLEIAGIVARTGEIVNIPNVQRDPRWNKGYDRHSTFTTRSMLCMPVMGKDGAIGVLEMINKKDGGCFTPDDEVLSRTFTVHCSLVLHNSKRLEECQDEDRRHAITKDLLNFHMTPSRTQLESFLSSPDIDRLPDNFAEFSWYITPDYVDKMIHLCYFMLKDIVGDCFGDNINSIANFLVIVRNSYRSNPYHNFNHAFNVTHCMYNILKRNAYIFTDMELKGLLIASMCHDLDHKGFTNNFLQMTNDSLIQLYEDSPLENHHNDVTMLILRSTGLFSFMNPVEYKKLIQQIKDAIMATDLAYYFRCRTSLVSIIAEGAFDWQDLMHRTLIKSIMMTSCDLSGQSKPYKVAKSITENLYHEFYNQGDIEKGMGLCPLSMMDRERQDLVPEDQIQFISVVCLPCNQILSHLLPNTNDLKKLSIDLQDAWREVMELRRMKNLPSPEESEIDILNVNDNASVQDGSGDIISHISFDKLNIKESKMSRASKKSATDEYKDFS